MGSSGFRFSTEWTLHPTLRLPHFVRNDDARLSNSLPQVARALTVCLVPSPLTGEGQGEGVLDSSLRSE